MDDERIKEMIIAVIERDKVLKDYLKKKCLKYVKQIDNSRDDTMFNNQAKTILKLQDQLKLSTFDVTESHKELRLAKERYKTARKTILKTREEIEEIRRNGDYENLGKVISYLRDVVVEDE